MTPLAPNNPKLKTPGFKTPELLHAMMDSLGIELNAEVLPRLDLRYPTAFHRCEACADKRACRDWLDHAAAPRLAPRFCGNADILFELQCDQAGPRHTAG